MVAFGQVIPVLPGSPLQLAILGVEAAIKDVPTQVSTEESATAGYCRR